MKQPMGIQLADLRVRPNHSEFSSNAVGKRLRKAISSPFKPTLSQGDLREI